jgi:hypothetical protein
LSGLGLGVLLELMYRIVMIGSVSDVFLLNAYRDALNWRAWVLAWVRRLYVSLGFRFVWNEAWLFLAGFVFERDELESLILAQSERWRHA